jgi:Ulp1 family protease
MYKKVAHLSKKVDLLAPHNGDIFLLKRIFFPINIPNVHWLLVVANVQDREIVYFDSSSAKTLGFSGRRYAQYVLDYMMDEFQRLQISKIPRVAVDDVDAAVHHEKQQWNITWYRTAPQQSTSDDCGVFTCMYAICLNRGFPVEVLDCRDVALYRRLLGHSIMSGNLSALSYKLDYYT